MGNKKMLPHIITLITLVVFIVLGLASASQRDGLETDGTIPEGYGQYTISNHNQKLSIIMITVNGIDDLSYSRKYEVNLYPASNSMLGGGRFTVGDSISGQNYLPIGTYEIILYWSNNAQTIDKAYVYRNRIKDIRYEP